MAKQKRRRLSRMLEFTTCIYCMRHIDGETVRHSGEHIIPKAFDGLDSFQIYCVCQECNGSFKRWEQEFATDSPTGLLRYQRRGPSKDQKTGLKNSVMHLPYGAGYGLLSGAHLCPHPERDGVTVAAQIGLPLAKDCYRFFTWSMLTSDTVESAKVREIARGYHSGNLLATTGTETPKNPERIHQWQNIVWGKGCPRDVQSMLSKLTLLGVLPLYASKLYPQTGEVTPAGEIKATAFATFSDEFRKVLVKIAMNYAAFTLGCRSVLSSTYDPIRSFVCGNGGPIRVDYNRQKSIEVLDADGNEQYRNLLKLETGPEGAVVEISLYGAGSFLVHLHDSRSLYYAKGHLQIVGEKLVRELSKSWHR